MSFLARFSTPLRPIAFHATRYYTTGAAPAAASESLLDRLKNDRKILMKAKKQPDLSVVKSLLSDFTYFVKSASFKEGTPDQEAIISVLNKAIKRRQESAKQFHDGKRPELAQQEEEELKVLQGYLPEQLSAEEIEEELKQIIGEVGAASGRDIGKVMKAWKHDAATADRKIVSETIKKLLN